MADMRRRESKAAAAPDLPPHWFQILLALADQDRHGLGIMGEVLDRTGGRMKLWPTSMPASSRGPWPRASSASGSRVPVPSRPC